MNINSVVIVMIFIFGLGSCNSNEKESDDSSKFPKGLKIAFTSYRTGTAEIFFMNPDGTEVEQITNSDDDNSYAEFVDGRTLRFFRSQNRQNFIKWDKDLSSGVESITELNPIVEGAQFEQVQPSGALIAYAKEVDGINELFLYNPSSKSSEQLTRNQEDGLSAHSLNHEWSRDGTRIAFMSGVDWYNQVPRIYDLESKTTQALTDRGYMNSGLLWLKDGSGLILNIKIRGEIYELYRVNADDTSLQQLTGLTDETIANIHPKLSPDGNWVVFESQRDGGESEIYVMKPDGSEQKRLTFDGKYNGRPAWFQLDMDFR